MHCLSTPFAVDSLQLINKLVAIGAGEGQQGFVQGDGKDRNYPLQLLIDCPLVIRMSQLQFVLSPIK